VIIRTAVHDDLPEIVALLARDVLGAGREAVGEGDEIDDAYEWAFADIYGDPRNILVVGEQGGEVVAFLQVTYIPGLSRRGAERCQIESVRVRSDLRGSGLGRQLVTWVIERARERGCNLVQLTADKTRTDALRFYESVGFVPTHEGFKLLLGGPPGGASADAGD
jgi:ribosomal protein S18 acetylase RimI-like enzyme